MVDRSMKSECVYVWMYVCSTQLHIALETAKIDPHFETKLRMVWCNGNTT